MKNFDEPLYAWPDDSAPRPIAPPPPEPPPAAPSAPAPSAPASAPPDGAPPSSFLTPEDEQNLHARYVARLGDLKREALQQKDPLVAILAGVTCGLVRISMKMEETVLAAQNQAAVTSENAAHVERQLHFLRRVTAQMERLAETQMRAATRHTNQLLDPWSNFPRTEPSPTKPR